MFSFKFQGFVLGTREWREKDKLVTVFTQEKGKIPVLAKSVRSIKSKRLGILETGNLIKGITFSSRKDSLSVLGDVKLLFQPLGARNNLKIMAAIFYLGEIASAILPEGEPEARVFQLFSQTIRQVSKIGSLDKVIKFSIELPGLVGFGISKEAQIAMQKRDLPLALELSKRHISYLTEKKIKSLQLTN